MHIFMATTVLVPVTALPKDSAPWVKPQLILSQRKHHPGRLYIFRDI